MYFDRRTFKKNITDPQKLFSYLNFRIYLQCHKSLNPLHFLFVFETNTHKWKRLFDAIIAAKTS